MILFDLKETLDNISTSVNSFLTTYGSNPIVWVLIFVIIIAIAFWAISNLSSK